MWNRYFQCPILRLSLTPYTKSFFKDLHKGRPRLAAPSTWLKKTWLGVGLGSSLGRKGISCSKKVFLLGMAKPYAHKFPQFSWSESELDMRYVCKFSVIWREVKWPKFGSQSSMNFFLPKNLKAQIMFIEKMFIVCTVKMKVMGMQMGDDRGSRQGDTAQLDSTGRCTSEKKGQVPGC